MQTQLAPQYQASQLARDAEAIVRKCVHCGFCTATCPTYQVLGDELDGPRGRIYLIKQVLEGAPATREVQMHLDRCLTCRNCETTCPSGVEYSHLLEIGRDFVEQAVQRPLAEKATRAALRVGLSSGKFETVLKTAHTLRGVLPKSLQEKIPEQLPVAKNATWPQSQHPRKMLLMANCVQPAFDKDVDAATARILDAAGISLLPPAHTGCCGAMKSHLGDPAGGLDLMRKQIDAWWPLVNNLQLEAIVSNVSGCGLMAKEYGHALRHDPAYADKAQHISSLVRDASELLPAIVEGLVATRGAEAAAQLGQQQVVNYHPPCTLQHGQKLKMQVPDNLKKLGFDIQITPVESHICCGSAGTYSITQPELSRQLRDRKLGHLAFRPASVIASANIGCISHLQTGTETPVRHWIHLLDEALQRPSTAQGAAA